MLASTVSTIASLAILIVDGDSFLSVNNLSERLELTFADSCLARSLDLVLSYSFTFLNKGVFVST